MTNILCCNFCLRTRSLGTPAYPATLPELLIISPLCQSEPFARLIVLPFPFTTSYSNTTSDHTLKQSYTMGGILDLCEVQLQNTSLHLTVWHICLLEKACQMLMLILKRKPKLTVTPSLIIIYCHSISIFFYCLFILCSSICRTQRMATAG